MTKLHRRGLNTGGRHPRSWRPEPEVQAWAGPGPPEASLLVCGRPSSPCPRGVVPLCVSGSRSPLLTRTPSHGIRTHPSDPSNHLCEDPIASYGHILGSWGSGPQQEFGGHNSAYSAARNVIISTMPLTDVRCPPPPAPAAPGYPRILSSHCCLGAQMCSLGRTVPAGPLYCLCKRGPPNSTAAGFFGLTHRPARDPLLRAARAPVLPFLRPASCCASEEGLFPGAPAKGQSCVPGNGPRIHCCFDLGPPPAPRRCHPAATRPVTLAAFVQAGPPWLLVLRLRPACGSGGPCLIEAPM